MEPMIAGVTASGQAIDGIAWDILGQTYRPLQRSENSMAWHALFPPGTFVPRMSTWRRTSSSACWTGASTCCWTGSAPPPAPAA